jgi:hypothetical protein
MSDLSIIVQIKAGPTIYNTKEEAIDDVKNEIAQDYSKYNRYTYEYNVYQDSVTKRWYIETRVSKKINVINKEIIIEI